MRTDWNMIRDMIGAAIDACEKIEKTGFVEEDREATIDVNGQDVSLHDILVSAWTLPENLRYRIIRARHEAGTDRAYVPETARIIVAMAEAAAEMIGAGENAPDGGDMRTLIDWYGDRAVPGIEQAVASRRPRAA